MPPSCEFGQGSARIRYLSSDGGAGVGVGEDVGDGEGVGVGEGMGVGEGELLLP